MILNIMGYIFLLAFTCACFWSIYALIIQPQNALLRAFRLMSAGLGFMIFFASEKLNISIQDIVFLSLDGTGGLTHTLILSVLPTFVGFFASTILIGLMGRADKTNEVSVRFIVFLLSLFAFTSASVFLFSTDHGDSSQILVANVLFVAGVMMSVLFNAGQFRSIQILLGSKTVENGSSEAEHKKRSDWTSKL